jgi:hypothetical protein
MRVASLVVCTMFGCYVPQLGVQHVQVPRVELPAQDELNQSSRCELLAAMARHVDACPVSCLVAACVGSIWLLVGKCKLGWRLFMEECEWLKVMSGETCCIRRCNPSQVSCITVHDFAYGQAAALSPQ